MNAPPPSSADAHSTLRTEHCALSIEDARALVAAPLWPRIRVFLWDFASLCDPERLTGSLVTHHSSLVTAEGLLGSPRIARSAEQTLGVAPVFHSFPADDGSRLLLLSREDYDRLAQFLGTIALAPALRRVTAGADVRVLKSALPGVYPEALAYTAYFRKHETLFKQVAPTDDSGNSSLVTRHSSLSTAVPAAGHTLLASALSNLPPELLLRQRLRFPVGSPADQALGADDSSLVTRHSSLAGEALAVTLLALKLSNPPEYNTLCS